MIDAAYAIRHNLWATRRLLEHVSGLGPEQRALTVPGTAGSVAFCLAHVVGADQRYLAGLGADIQSPFREAPDTDLELVMAVHTANEAAWERLLESPPDLEGWFDHPARPYRVRLRVLVAQAIHHGTDHRTQVGTILLHHGLSLPDLDVWSFGQSQGDVVPRADRTG